MALIKDLFTEKDAVSFCPLRVGFIIGFIVIIGLTIEDAAHFMDHVGDWIKGMAQYLGFGGGAIGYKNTTEGP